MGRSLRGSLRLSHPLSVVDWALRINIYLSHPLKIPLFATVWLSVQLIDVCPNSSCSSPEHTALSDSLFATVSLRQSRGLSQLFIGHPLKGLAFATVSFRQSRCRCLSQLNAECTVPTHHVHPLKCSLFRAAFITLAFRARLCSAKLHANPALHS